MFLENKTLLITGGTGSFGSRLVERLLASPAPPAIIRIFSRDEQKHFQMARELHNRTGRVKLQFVIGDIRDYHSIKKAVNQVDMVVHTAAMKHVPLAEDNPLEAVKTNILGTANLVRACQEEGVEKVLGFSTDKAANPINLYGATKLCSDKLLIQANQDLGNQKEVSFSSVRYGNVMESRGGVLALFKEIGPGGEIPLTHLEITRFWITMDRSLDFVLFSLKTMQGGEIFVPKVAAMKVVDIARTVAPGCSFNITGLRPGDKLQEVLIPLEDGINTLEYDQHYLVLPPWFNRNNQVYKQGKPVPEGFCYTTQKNCRKMTKDELLKLL